MCTSFSRRKKSWLYARHVRCTTSRFQTGSDFIHDRHLHPGQECAPGIKLVRYCMSMTHYWYPGNVRPFFCVTEKFLNIQSTKSAGCGYVREFWKSLRPRPRLSTNFIAVLDFNLKFKIKSYFNKARSNITFLPKIFGDLESNGRKLASTVTISGH